MAFQKQAEHSEKEFPKITDIPLLKEYAQDKKFCKSGIFQVEHLVTPGRYQNFTLINYTINVRINVGPNNSQNYEFLVKFAKSIKADDVSGLWLGCEIRDRMKGYVNVGTDDEKGVTWVKHALGFAIKTDGPF